MKFTSRPVITLLKMFATSIFILTLVACVSRPSLESQTVIQLNNNLAQLQNWKLKGKIAWITPTERKSAYMNWHQEQKSMQFDLSNIVGINLASLTFNGETAILKADGKEYNDPSPSALIRNTTGWNVPLEQLSSWVKGALTSNGRNSKNTNNDLSSHQQVIRYENGLIKQIKPNCEMCDQWTIYYTMYENVSMGDTQYQLPKQISMHNSAYQANIKIKISEWSQ